MDRLRFQSFGSGSSGNCYYIGNASNGLLIDAGLGVRTIRKCLRDIGLEFSDLWGVFVTHDHADHVKAVGPIGERHRVPIYSTRKVHEGIDRSYCVTEKLHMSRKFIEKNQTLELGDYKITAFPVSHDSHDSVGYTVEYKGKRITIATDLGEVGTEVADHFSKADMVILESNYDEQMLMTGKYPQYLKNRVAGSAGHLSNDQAGAFLAEVYHDKIQYVFLCHLSKENNLPDLAFSTVEKHLAGKQIVVQQDVQLVVLDRLTPSELFVFED